MAENSLRIKSHNFEQDMSPFVAFQFLALKLLLL